jgi:Ca2+-binding RTX toxin-like protein
MAKGELEYDDLSDFFERTYEVSSHSDTSWVFRGISEKFGNWSVEFQGSGLTGDGDFPAGGTITHVIIKDPDGTITDELDVSLSASDLASNFELDDDHGGNDHGSGHDDDIAGDGSDDNIDGKGGDDHIDGGDGDDELHGQGGDDDLNGGAGDDKLVGSGGKDNLFGDTGDDVLKGQGKNDRLDGGKDDDLLIGGGGKDVYVFGPNFGHDTIKKFQTNKDVIDLKGTGLKSTDDFADIAYKKHGAVITIDDDNSIKINKIQGHDKSLDSDDFLFA